MTKKTRTGDADAADAIAKNKEASDDDDLFGDGEDDTDDKGKATFSDREPFRDSDDDESADIGTDKRLPAGDVDEEEIRTADFERTTHELVPAARANAEASVSAHNYIPSNAPNGKQKDRSHAPDDKAGGVNISRRRRFKSFLEDESSVALANDTMVLSARHLERRRTKTWAARKKMDQGHLSVTNVIPGLPRKKFSNREAFHAELDNYHE